MIIDKTVRLKQREIRRTINSTIKREAQAYYTWGNKTIDLTSLIAAGTDGLANVWTTIDWEWSVAAIQTYCIKSIKWGIGQYIRKIEPKKDNPFYKVAKRKRKDTTNLKTKMKIYEKLTHEKLLQAVKKEEYTE